MNESEMRVTGFLRAAPSSGAALRLVLGAMLSWGCVTVAQALGLGEVVEQSALGEPLRFVIPVLANSDDLTGDELAPECVRLVPPESARSAELPQITFGRAMLERSAAGVRVVVTSNAVAHDPALSFTVQAGCRLKLRHEYTVLLDPPIIREPTALADAGAEAPQSVTSTPPPAHTAASVAGTTSTPRSATRARARSRADGTRQATAARASARQAASKAPASIVADNARPRLTVSRSAQGPSAGSTDIARGRSDEEIRHEVEAETIVLQRRIAELSATLERMEAELREAKAAREAAEQTVKPAPAAQKGPDPWLVSVLLGVVVLALAALLVRARRESRLTVPAFLGAAETAEEMPTALGAGTDMPFHTTRPAPAVTMPPHPDAAAPRTDNDDAFDEDLLHYAEQASAYSVLEREHPKLIATVVRDWGKPRVIAYLRDLLVSPRKGTRPFSQGAVSDLILLQSLAMERAGYRADESPWQVELDHRQRA